MQHAMLSLPNKWSLELLVQLYPSNECYLLGYIHNQYHADFLNASLFLKNLLFMFNFLKIGLSFISFRLWFEVCLKWIWSCSNWFNGLLLKLMLKLWIVILLPPRFTLWCAILNVDYHSHYHFPITFVLCVIFVHSILRSWCILNCFMKSLFQIILKWDFHLK